jgi:hypothetical protein
MTGGKLTMTWLATMIDLEHDLQEFAPGGLWTERHLHLWVYKSPAGAIVRCYSNRTVHLQGANAAAADLFVRLDRRNRARAPQAQKVSK